MKRILGLQWVAGKILRVKDLEADWSAAMFL